MIAVPLLATSIMLGSSCNTSATNKESVVSNGNNEANPALKTESTASIKMDHSSFDALLKAHVAGNGAVDYKGLKADEAKLDAYITLLAKEIPSESWSKEEAKAYWLNAYNANTIKLILDKYPVKSIQDINKGKPWDIDFITLAGKKYTLNNIENDIIRPTYNDPRIHFAINCAAKSCPPLANAAFTAENVDSMLDARAKSFINSKANTLKGKTIKISKIFDWYQKDFGDVVTFINKYAAQKVEPNVKLTYSEYDWSLNSSMN